jgi:hypothetical protein
MPQGDFRGYDSDQYSASFAGIPLAGFADGEWLRIERENQKFDDVVGTDGEVTRSKTNDDRATITIRLMQSSPVNDLLSAVYNLDGNTPGGAGVGPFLLRDQQGTTLITAESCWIAKAPDVSMDRTATEREWVLRCAKLIEFHGGSIPPA